MQSKTPTTKGTANAKLPTIHIAMFSGKYSDYVQFINLFRSVIQNDPALDDLHKLHYQRSFLKDEAFDLIKKTFHWFQVASIQH